MSDGDMACRLAAMEARHVDLVDRLNQRLAVYEGTFVGLAAGSQTLATIMGAGMPHLGLDAQLKAQIAALEQMPSSIERDAAVAALRKLVTTEAPRPPTFSVIDGGKTD